MRNVLPELKPRLVGIAGCSGAGKTWLAARLRERLGKESAVIALDDFYLDRSHLPLSRRSAINFDHPRSIDWPLLESVLSQARRGLPFRVPEYDFAAHSRRFNREWRRPSPIILVEGLWLLRRPSIRRLFAFKIYVRCPRGLCLQRRLERDTRERGRSAASVRAQFRERVAPMGERFVEPQERWANLVIESPIAPETIEAIAASLRGLRGRATTIQAP